MSDPAPPGQAAQAAQTAHAAPAADPAGAAPVATPAPVTLIGNNALFQDDLAQMGRVFFPASPRRVLVPRSGTAAPGATDPGAAPGPTGAVAAPTPAGPGAGPAATPAPGWLVTLSALPVRVAASDEPAPDRPASFHVAVAVTRPGGGAYGAADHVKVDPGAGPRAYTRTLRRGARRLLAATLSAATGDHPAWGTLTGVRPTKLMHDLLDRGHNPAAAAAVLVAERRLAPEQAALLATVAAVQRPFLAPAPGDVAIYIGIPWCPTICSFCSFSVYTMAEHRGQVGDYLAALGHELTTVGDAIRALGLQVVSLYIGGGTPTSPGDGPFAALLDCIGGTVLRGQAPREYTIEAGRPETITRHKLDAMAAHGVTRISVNPQTTVQATLARLGRVHTVASFLAAYERVRSHPHPFVVNSDIIIGLPGEGPAEVAHTLSDMRRLAPDQLTVHTMAVKRGSRLHEVGDGPGALGGVGQNEAATMAALASATAAALGQRPYYLYRYKDMVGALENVGYSRPGLECLYNIYMMEQRHTIVGLGHGATTHYYRPDARWLLSGPGNPKEPDAYMRQVADLAAAKTRHLHWLFGR